MCVKKNILGTYCGSCPRHIFMNKTEVIPILMKLIFLLGKTNNNQDK